MRDSQEVLSRQAPGPDFTLAYGEHPDQVADVWVPPVAPKAVVVFLHGGFWRHAYDRTHVRPLAVALAGAGFAVVTPEYRRTGAPGGGWPGTLDDVATAVRAVPDMVAARTGVTGPPVLAGHSAGGHLALWAGAWLVRDGRTPRGVVALAAVADLAAAHALNLGAGAVSTLLGGGPSEVPQRYAYADPAALLPLGATLVLCPGGRDQDVPPEMSRRFASAARASGDDVTLLEWPDADHFDVIDPESEIWPDVVAAVARVVTG